jgi:hypothetical protein
MNLFDTNISTFQEDRIELAQCINTI